VNIRDAFTALALGDALGVTSEFASLDEVKFTYKLNDSTGWPFKCIGGGPFGFRAYHPTDDTEMAAAIVMSWKEHRGVFNGEQIANNFIAWMNTGPRCIGITTRTALTAVKNGADWWEGGRAIWEANPHAWSNGSLMRNGVIYGMGFSLVDVFDNTLHHGMITHWAPLAAICCAAQSWILNDSYEIDEDNWRESFRRDWDFWMASTHDPVSKEWLELTYADQEEAWEIFEDADFDRHSFRPFDEIEHISFCLTTLQIGIWAMQWAMSDEKYPTEYLPEGFPTEPFQRTGKDVMGWVAMIGRDADTYGATAGPMVGIWHALDEDELRFLQGLDLIHGGNDIIERDGDCESTGLYWRLDTTSEYDRVSSDEDFEGVFKLTTDTYTVIYAENFAWNGPHELGFAPIVVAVLRNPSEEEVDAAMLSAIKDRKALNFVCTFCAKLCQPWQSNDGAVCHGCATDHFGVVY
jgi:ADP-ribosylglycohydrolase